MDACEFKEFICNVDSDGNGFISPEEFEKQFKGAENKLGKKLTDEQVQEAIKAMDKDKDGLFSIKELLGWMVTAGYLPESHGLGWCGPLRIV
jgi:Ca2+-binding EF-hand superfamily protein